LLYRLCSAVIEQATAGERLRLSLEEAGETCRFSISRPAGLRGLGDAQLFDTRVSEDSDGEALALGIGFPLRLVRLPLAPGPRSGADRGRRARYLAGGNHAASSARLIRAGEHAWRGRRPCLSAIRRGKGL
jgi:hypothetical protein